MRNIKPHVNSIGILQGRLTPSHTGKLQCFPKNNWQREFKLAKSCGFGAIQLLFEEDNHPENPLLNLQGVSTLNHLSDIYGVAISSILVDYSMAHTLLTVGKGYHETILVFEHLVRQASRLNTKQIVWPLFELDDIDWSCRAKKMARELRNFMRFAGNFGVSIILESNMPAQKLTNTLDEIDSGDIGFCYDLGNAAANGFDPAKEIRLLGNRISSVHVKDRLSKGGPNVVLGTGSVDFCAAFRALCDISYKGDFICETTRGQDPVETAKLHIQFIRKYLEGDN